MRDKGKARRQLPDQGDASTDAVLQAKYLDYCSARVAEVLLQLTADDMYVLAQEVSAESAEPSRPPSFNTIVRLATEKISRQLALPDFPEWVRDYRADPERFEQQMLGLWETDLGASRQSTH